MSQKKRGLGKGLGDLGLSELLGSITETQQTAVATAPTTTTDTATAVAEEPDHHTDGAAKLKHLPVDLIVPGRFQPRKIFKQEELQELADSIKAQGIIQPLVVRRMNDKYELIAGERRWRAAQLAHLSEVPAVVRDIPDEAAMAMALIENIQRRDLNVIEEAEALNRLILEFQMTHQEVSEAVGKSRTVVTNLLRLLKLNPDVRALVEQGKLEMGHARALLALEGLQQSKVATVVVKRQLSVRQTEQLIRQFNEKLGKRTASTQALDPDILSLKNNLSETLGAEVEIQQGGKGKGKLVIHFNSNDELQGILDHIK